MSTKDTFPITTFKILLSVVAVVIMVPFFHNTTDNSFYVTVCVYVLGKFIDLIDKIVDRSTRVSFTFYMLGIILSIISISLCFYIFLCVDYIEKIKVSYNVILMLFAFALGVIDLIDYFCFLGRWIRTKKVLKQLW